MGKRGPACQVCKSERRAEIEVALINHVPLRTIGARFSLTKDVVSRHGRLHMTAAGRAALLTNQRPSAIDLEKLERAESEGLLSNTVAQRARLLQLIDKSLQLGDTRAANGLERTYVANLELTGKLLGQLVQRHEVRSTSILVSADYLQLRHTVLSALAPFPEARRAVAVALHALEEQAKQEIEQKRLAPPAVHGGAAEIIQ